MTDKETTFAEIFDKLGRLDIKDYTEEKGPEGNKLTYLKWGWAYKLLIDNYPDARLEVVPWQDHKGQLYMYHPSPVGNMVKVAVSIEGHTREEILPVMDFRNKSVPEPTSFDINTAIQRCKVKCLGQFGLGLNLYVNDNLPIVHDPYTEEEWSDLEAILEGEGQSLAFAAWKQYASNQDVIMEKWLEPHKEARTITKEGKRLAELQAAGHVLADKYTENIVNFLDISDDMGIREIRDELSELEFKLVWSRFTIDQRNAVKQSLETTK